MSHVSVGTGLLLQGDLPAALSAFRAALVVAEAVLARDPSNAVWQRTVMATQGSLGSAHLAHGDTAAALRALRAAAKLAEAAIARDASDQAARRDLSIVQERMGAALEVRGDAAGALAAYRAALELRASLAALDDTTARRGETLDLRTQVGTLLVAQGHVEQGTAELISASGEAEQLAAADPTNPRFRKSLCTALVALGDALRRSGKVAEARRRYQAALEIAEQLIAAEPTNALVQAGLDEVRRKLRQSR